MGCCPQRKSHPKRYSLSLKNKSSFFVRLSTQEYNSILDSNHPFSTIKCIKEKVDPANLCILSEDLDLSGCYLSMYSSKYTSEYKFIKETYSKFAHLCLSFRSIIHEVCISGYQVHDGLFLMLVSIAANKSNNLKFLNSFPYFKCNKKLNEDTLKILQSWTDLSTYLESLSQFDFKILKKAQSRLEDFLSLIHQKPFISTNENISKSIFLCQCAILICSKMIKELKKFKTKVSNFFSGIKGKEAEIRDCGRAAGESGCYSASEILHQVLHKMDIKNL